MAVCSSVTIRRGEWRHRRHCRIGIIGVRRGWRKPVRRLWWDGWLRRRPRWVLHDAHTTIRRYCGMVGRERKCGDRLATGARAGGDPGATILHRVDVFSSKGRARLLLNASSRRPWVPNIVERGKVTPYHDECAHETTEGNCAGYGYGSRIREETHEETRDACRSEHGRDGGSRDDQENGRCPDHPMTLSEGDGAAHADMDEGK